MKLDRVPAYSSLNHSNRPWTRWSGSNALTRPLIKSYDYGTYSCSDEDDESEGYLQSTIDTKQNISPYSSIHRTDSGLIPRNEFPQSGTSTPGLTEVARQMSKVSDEMSTLCSNVSDLTSGIKNMLCEIDNGALQRSSCSTCGSPQHMAKECPSRLDYQEVQRRGLFNSKTVSQKPTGRRSRSDPPPSKARPKD